MNILIKLTCLIGLVIAPILGANMPEAVTPEIDEVTIQIESKERPSLSFSSEVGNEIIFASEADNKTVVASKTEKR